MALSPANRCMLTKWAGDNVMPCLRAAPVGDCCSVAGSASSRDTERFRGRLSAVLLAD